MTATIETSASEQVLNSWKEIARYLDRGVRTAQRWESDLGLPVRRPRGKSRSAVIAMRSEIDDWLRICPLAPDNGDHLVASAGHEIVVSGDGRNEGVPNEVSRVIMRSRILRREVSHSRDEWHVALNRMLGTLQSMADPPRQRAHTAA